ncbi:hypothetical protein VB776_06715 [Arcicella sp. DC2W]|uniref:Response regulator n=1 Tax=Arcicella gelida TaxID=2984195 RepID=A0ABU5S280_9BACT|nr:hypothetical protein [Arcicella sp. DC2W]MEA5402598.1 hypothetical protein [Arcicella sp. DC2W]
MMKFIWIDDNPERIISSNNLAASLEIKCDFIDVNKQDVGEIIQNLLKDEEPELIIIDHNLIDSIPNTNLIKKGSSAASIIRQQWKECPIVCFTGMEPSIVDSQEKNIYEEMYPIENISNYYAEIHSIATSFNEIKRKKPESINSLLTLLKCPIIDQEKVKAIIPKNLKENFHDGGLIIEISNWVRKTLMSRPGFLYDELWAATLLGLNETGFEKVKDTFERAKYTGIFSNDKNPRWWKSELINILGENVNSPGLPSHRGRLLERITEDDYSKCHATQEAFPETVAFVDESRDSVAVAIKLRETILHGGYEKLLYFDEIRLMAPLQ